MARHGWRWCRRFHGPGRPPKPRVIEYPPHERVVFLPTSYVSGVGDAVHIEPDELEALRLVYLENLTQEQAASRMGVSRGTVWRLIDSARRKITYALVYKKPIVIGSSEQGTS